MKIGDIVIAPEGCSSYLTVGNEYKVIYVSDELVENTPRGIGFDIIDDEGYSISCRERKCAFLRFGDWILKPTES